MAEKDKLIILAADPSLNRPGFAVLEIENRKATILATTIVDNSKTPRKIEERKSTPQKLLEISGCFFTLLKDFKPDILVRERGFSRFSLTTQLLFKVHGALDLIAIKNTGQEFIDIPPTEVKMVMTGSGKSEKQDVADALPYYVGERKYLTDDESDAVAIGLTYAIKNGLVDSVLVPRRRKKLGRPKKNAHDVMVLPHVNDRDKRRVGIKCRKIRFILRGRI